MSESGHASERATTERVRIRESLAFAAQWNGPDMVEWQTDSVVAISSLRKLEDRQKDLLTDALDIPAARKSAGLEKQQDRYAGRIAAAGKFERINASPDATGA